VKARESALLALEAFRKRGARPGMALANLAEREKMDRRETALALNIVDGVLQNEALCDWRIGRHTDAGKLEPRVLDILRISVYQLLFLTRVPSHAAVSEGVELTKRYAPRAAGLVNAVLRRVSGEKDAAPEVGGTGAERLSVLYSHPLWLVRELEAEYGLAACERILAADNTPAPVTLQVNTLKCTADEAAESLAADGAEVVRCPLFSDALRISGAGAVEELRAWRGGLVYAQDAAARMAVAAAAPEPGALVLDACAAPGGKSFAAAVLMRNRGRIVACDLHGKKLGQITRGAARLGITIIETAERDARTPAPELEGKADTVLADVPCSGLGVCRRKPEIRYKDEAELARLPALQLGILRSAARCVKPGGTLLYSTCTILRRENEGVAEAFLSGAPDFELSPFVLPEPFGACAGMRTILPYEGDTDGFFICRMKRKTE